MALGDGFVIIILIYFAFNLVVEGMSGNAREQNIIRLQGQLHT